MIQIDIPMPNSCYDCPCCRQAQSCCEDDICDALDMELKLFNDVMKCRHADCPLKEVSENNPFKKEFIRVMRDFTPEEQEAINKAIRDMSYDTGVTLQGLLDHEKYVPMSVLEQIKAEIPNLVRYESSDGQDLILAYDIARLIDEYIDGKEQTDGCDN